MKPPTGVSHDDARIRERLGRNLTYGMLEMLGRDIVVGEFDDQPFPTEGVLSQQHGVSRSVTREAVKMLAAKGLLGSRARQGTFVQPEDSWNLFDSDVLHWLFERKPRSGVLDQFSELRMSIEPEAASLAAGRTNRDEIAPIAESFTRMRDAQRGLDDRLEAEVAFHAAVLRASGNPFFVQFCDMVTIALRASIRFTHRVAGGPLNMGDYEAVYAAIAAGTPTIAHRAMRQLLNTVSDSTRAIGAE